MRKSKRSDESTTQRARKAQNVLRRRPRKGKTLASDELIQDRRDEAKRDLMTTNIYDRNGELAPTVAVSEIRRNIGKFWKLVDRRGAVAISQGGETLAVGLSLDHFALLLLEFQPRPRSKKRKTALIQKQRRKTRRSR